MSDARLARMQAILEEQHLDALLVTKPENRRFLSGFTGSAGALLLTPAKSWLIADFRYVDQVRAQCPEFELVVQKGNLYETLSQLLDQERVSQVGFEANFLTYAEAQALSSLESDLAGARFVPTYALVESQRVVKDADERLAIARAAEIADGAFARILSFLRPGVSEREVALELETEMRRRGAERRAFDTIVASGPRSAWPHGVASDKFIEAGELVTLDFGAVVNGYCSDITRTVAVGRTSRRQREVYAAVLESQLLAIEKVQAGVSGRDVDRAARSNFAALGCAEAFGHGVGHGIGLEIHEAPSLSQTSSDTLRAGMVVTIEPGLYFPDFGGVRIEDDVWVGADGIEVLTSAPKHDLICL